MIGKYKEGKKYRIYLPRKVLPFKLSFKDKILGEREVIL